MRVAIAILLAGMLGACAGGDRAAGDPLRRSVNWFSVAGGEDLRAACAPGAPTRYRLVYNAIWEEQVRLYEVLPDMAGAGAALRVTVIRGAPRILQSYLLDPGASRTVEGRLSPDQLRQLVAALAEAGFARGPADGTRLLSGDFYWLVSACADGVWRLNAWRRQDPGFVQLDFARLLTELDPTGIPANPVRSIDPAQNLSSRGGASGEGGQPDASPFTLVIRGGRLWGLPRLW